MNPHIIAITIIAIIIPIFSPLLTKKYYPLTQLCGFGIPALFLPFLTQIPGSGRPLVVNLLPQYVHTQCCIFIKLTSCSFSILSFTKYIILFRLLQHIYLHLHMYRLFMQIILFTILLLGRKKEWIKRQNMLKNIYGLD